MPRQSCYFVKAHTCVAVCQGSHVICYFVKAQTCVAVCQGSHVILSKRKRAWLYAKAVMLFCQSANVRSCMSRQSCSCMRARNGVQACVSDCKNDSLTARRLRARAQLESFKTVVFAPIVIVRPPNTHRERPYTLCHLRVYCMHTLPPQGVLRALFATSGCTVCVLYFACTLCHLRVYCMNTHTHRVAMHTLSPQGVRPEHIHTERPCTLCAWHN
jgi:hypothetical protein